MCVEIDEMEKKLMDEQGQDEVRARIKELEKDAGVKILAYWTHSLPEGELVADMNPVYIYRHGDHYHVYYDDGRGGEEFMVATEEDARKLAGTILENTGYAEVVE